MTDISLAKFHYRTAKADHKRDLTACIVLAITFAVAAIVILFLFASDELGFTIGARIVFCCLMGIAIGVYLACFIFSLITVFKYAWNHLGFISILLIIILYALAASFAVIIAVAKLSIGYIQIRKLGKAIGMV